MGQVLIRNLDDELLADYRQLAAANGRSLEAELREALRKAKPLPPLKREEALRRLAEVRAMAPTGVGQTPSELLLRELRDGHRE